MKSEKLAVVRGSGNVFRNLGRASADVEQLKALLAAEIIKALERQADRSCCPYPNRVRRGPISRVSVTPPWRDSQRIV
jgi:hypothetical protein